MWRLGLDTRMARRALTEQVVTLEKRVSELESKLASSTRSAIRAVSKPLARHGKKDGPNVGRNGVKRRR